MAKSPADQQIADDEAQLNQDVAAVESTEAPTEATAPADTPAADPTVATDSTATPADAPAPTEDEAPTEDASEPAEAAPAADAADVAVAADEAQLATDEAADAAEDAAQPDLTPVEEAAPQVSNGPGQIDGSGIAQQTNQEVIDNLPKNENGQVVIDENGQIVGVDGTNQPAPQPGSQA